MTLAEFLTTKHTKHTKPDGELDGAGLADHTEEVGAGFGVRA